MTKKISALLLTILAFGLTSCGTFHNVVIWKPFDLLIYPAIYIGLSYLIAKILSDGEKSFWMYFIISILTTPILVLLVTLLFRSRQNK